jgi:hypothetical protein
MLHEYVGQWFIKAPSIKRAKPDAICSRCGATGVTLWKTSATENSCIAQIAITAKRPARSAAGDPPPGPDATGKFTLGKGSMAIAGPHIARVLTKLSPAAGAPPSLSVTYATTGIIRTWLRELAENPPSPPFVVVIFGQNASFPIIVTTDPSRIVINGASTRTMDASLTKRLLTMAAKIGPEAVRDAARLRQRLASGEGTDAQRRRDADAFAKLRNSMTTAEFRALPPPGSTELIALDGSWPQEAANQGEMTP